MPVQHKMHICDWLKLLLNMYLSICNNTAYPFMLRWVLCVVNINNILFTLCACCCSNIAFCVCFTCYSFEILHFIVALFFLCVSIFLSLSFSVLCIQLTVSRNESTSCYDDISIFKGETKAISIRYARLIGSLFFIIKNIHEMKTIFIFSLLNFTFTSTASYWGQIWCGHAARFLVFIAQLRVVAVYYVIFCMMKFNRLIIML